MSCPVLSTVQCWTQNHVSNVEYSEGMNTESHVQCWVQYSIEHRILCSMLSTVQYWTQNLMSNVEYSTVLNTESHVQCWVQYSIEHRISCPMLSTVQYWTQNLMSNVEYSTVLNTEIHVQCWVQYSIEHRITCPMLSTVQYWTQNHVSNVEYSTVLNTESRVQCWVQYSIEHRFTYPMLIQHLMSSMEHTSLCPMLSMVLDIQHHINILCNLYNWVYGSGTGISSRSRMAIGTWYEQICFDHCNPYIALPSRVIKWVCYPMYTHTNPWGKIKWPYAITKLTAHFMYGLIFDLMFYNFRKNVVIRDTECPYWNQVSWSNTKPNQTKLYIATVTHLHWSLMWSRVHYVWKCMLVISVEIWRVFSQLPWS